MSKTIESKSVTKNTDSDKIKSQLQKWAHEGTKESIAKIQGLQLKTMDKNLILYIQLAYEEACLFYYGPSNEKEEKEFTLARMINKREKQLLDMTCELNNLDDKLEKLKLNEEVHKRVMKNNKNHKDWQYNFSPDFVGVIKNEKKELLDSLKYESEWVEEAKKMITTEKYKDIPYAVFDFIHPDFDDDLDYDEDDEDYDETICPYCGNDNTEEI